MLKKILTSPWTALITLTLIVGIRIADPAFVESVRLRYFDTLVTSKPAEVIGVSVVNIDEKALEKYGQFPFSRNTYGSIIRELYRRNAGLVVFNVLTPDLDRMGQDSSYVQALHQYPTILPNVGSQTSRNTPKVPGSVVIGPYERPFITYPGIIANVPAIETAAVGVGLVNTLPEVDGVVRRMPMVATPRTHKLCRPTIRRASTPIYEYKSHICNLYLRSIPSARQRAFCSQGRTRTG